MAPMPPTGLQRFFEEYAAASLGPEPEGVAAFYGEGFLAAGPQGSAVFQNDQRFLGWLRQVHDFNESAGMVSLAVAVIEEYSLSTLFTVATVEWGARFVRTGDRRISFKISYILRNQDGDWKILGYLSHVDQAQAMREEGLL